MNINLQNSSFYNKCIDLSTNKLFKTKFENDLSLLKAKIIKTSRTSTVVAGCLRKSTRAITVTGNFSGIVGVGAGKALNWKKANKRSFNQSIKELIHVPITHDLSIPLFTWARFCASTVKLYPSNFYSGIKAAGPTKTIVELAGLKNITCVKIGSANIFNTAKATIFALSLLAKHVEDLVNHSLHYKHFFKKKLINAQYFSA